MGKLVWLGGDRLAFEPDEVLPPVPEAREVVVRVRAVGICGTDIHILDGRFPLARPPRVLGHEIAGDVVAVGQQVTRVRVGDRVTVDQVVGCGECVWCRRGSRQFCPSGYELGITADGGCQQFIVLPESNVYGITDNISYAEAAVLDMEVWAALRKPSVQQGDTVLVIGTGPAGLIAAQVASILGARKVLLAARSSERLRQAEALGVADVVLCSEAPDFQERVNAESGGYGADLTIDCAGTPESAQLAIGCVRPGGRVVLFGVYTRPIPSIDLNQIVLKDIVIYGALSDRTGWEEVIQLVATGRLRLAPLITHRFALRQGSEAYALVRDKALGVIKAVLEVE